MQIDCARTRKWLFLLFSIALSSAVHGQEAPYIVRGRRTDATRAAFAAHYDRVREALADAIRRDAPDLLPTLEPVPPPSAAGYGRLPRLVDDGRPYAGPSYLLSNFSWSLSDSRLAVQEDALREVESTSETLAALPTAAARVKALPAVIAGFRRVAEARRALEGNVSYNWFWQRQIALDRPRFDANTKLIDDAQAAAASGGNAGDFVAAGAPRSLPPFVRYRLDGPKRHVFSVAVSSDVDEAFLAHLIRAFEGHWRVEADGEEFAVRVDARHISPEQLYCAAPSSPACAPPALGAPIDVHAHLARFPADRAVITTGADALHVTGGRALMLTPYDVSPRVLAHEFGHLLGFDDGYVRGYRDLGADGFRILEFVPDMGDIMAAPGAGAVRLRHFRQLLAVASPR